jgi:hypothetical protein
MWTQLTRAWLAICGVGTFLAFSAVFAQTGAEKDAPPLPAVVTSEHPQLKMRGKGLLTWFGFRVYNATLWTSNGTASRTEPYALELQYLRNLDGEALATRSIDEMKGQGVGTEAQHEAWLPEMRKAFPNVKTNDRIVGLHLPGKGAKFFHNGKLTHEVNDVTFARAFFDIWLSPKTSQPALRRSLLGES